MDDIAKCEVMDFGIVNPGKVYKKKLRTTSSFLVKDVLPSPHIHPLDDVFSVVRAKSSKNANPERENCFIFKFQPVLPNRQSFGYYTVRMADGSSRKLYLKAQTKGPDVRLSTGKIYFFASSSISTPVYKFTMENRSDCADSFCWDFIPENSEVEISPHDGVIPADSRLRITVLFKPKKKGLFYRPFTCLFRYQEPLYIEVYGFHGKTPLRLNLERYIFLDDPHPSFSNEAVRYMSDTIGRSETKPIVTQSKRYIDFGKATFLRNRNVIVLESVTLTNHSLKDLVAVWDKPCDTAFHVEPRNAVIPQRGGSVMFDVSFSPTAPDLFYRAEIHASFQWGTHNEFKAPVSVTLYLIGDSFSSDGCGWPPSYAIETTRIIMPGTIPNFPSFVPISIWKIGPLPMHFKLEPVAKSGRFAVKPSEGVIKSDFQLVVVMFYPDDKVDVIYKEEWQLVINRLLKVNLEFCGSSELPFLLAGEGKNVTVPPILLGCWSTSDVLIKNPTRLELRCRWPRSSDMDVTPPKDVRPIAPGETISSNMCFRFDKLGPFTRARSIHFYWAPSNPGTLKALKGRKVSSETVLCLHGLVEAPNVRVEKDKVTMKSVFLDDISSTSLAITNETNSVIHMKLGCFPPVYSRIGYWEFFPNPFSVGPQEKVEVKMNMIGQSIGYQLFMVKYVMLDSSTYSRETSEWIDLCEGDILVYFTSLKVLDLRYEGLAKSLSKHTLWNLLQINSLNDHLNNLADKQERCVPMTIPKYHHGTPPLSVEMLLKNTSPISVHLEAAVSKNCTCPPKRIDTISKRYMDYSCEHDSQVEVELRERKILPNKTGSLIFTLHYDDSEACVECPFTIVLSVSTSKEMQRHRRIVRLVIDRGIIKCLASNLNVLLPGEYGTKTFDFKLEDVYVGDRSTYHQVVWLYNHSQNDIRYWVEWLYVNKKVFKILNDRGKVDAYTSHPLLVSFTPFEMKSYWAQLAVVNEIGEEVHINFTGSGSVNPLVCHPNSRTSTVRMLNKVPPVSQFEDSHGELAFSVDHIALKPIPTHSFDKYVFFMHNTSKSVQSFRWERGEIWSVVDVSVFPSYGELQPGEIFPVQMHIKTLRLPAIFNFSIECLFYDKSKSVHYWEKCHFLEKATKLFDTCFVFVPDNQIEIAYQNPSSGMLAGEPPKNKIAAIGVSIHIFNREHMDSLLPLVSDQFCYIPPPKLKIESARFLALDIGKKEAIAASQILKKIIRNIVDSAAFKEIIKRKNPEIRYIDLPDKEDNLKVFPKLSGKPLSMLRANIIYTTLVNFFGFDTCVYHEMIDSVQGKERKEKMLRIFNAYYERILRMAVDQACAPPENERVKRTYSRDQLAIVRRMSTSPPS